MKDDRRDILKLATAVSLGVGGGLGVVASAVPARVAAATGGSIMTATALKYSPDATVEDSYPSNLPGVLPRQQVIKLAEAELSDWLSRQQNSKKMTRRAKKSSPFGVPGNHQKDWNNMPQNIYCERAYGNKFRDIDGNEYLDFCLGDTPDMYGHGGINPAIKAAAASMSASDSNRAVLAIARQVTGRNWGV